VTYPEAIVSAGAESLSLLQELGDVLEVGMLALDRELVVRGWNRWLAVASDREPAEVVGRPLFELFSLRGADPFEESVAWELNSYGPVVAVGRPGRSLASLGAAREHLSDATWKEHVAERMEEAGIIAVATGETDGLAWELGQVVSGGHIAKTFFVFPPVAPAELGRRWEHTAASLEHAGQPVGPLPVPPSRIHTVRLETDGRAMVTYASRRDEATYRTAVDHAVDTTVTSLDPA